MQHRPISCLVSSAYNIDTVDMVYTVEMVYTIDMVYTVDMFMLLT